MKGSAAFCCAALRQRQPLLAAWLCTIASALHNMAVAGKEEKNQNRKKEHRPRTRTKNTEHGAPRFACGAVRAAEEREAAKAVVDAAVHAGADAKAL